MSVVNQMLRELDQRQASAQDRAGLPQRLRTLPSLPLDKLQPWHWLLGGAFIGALAAGGAVWFMAPAETFIPAPVVTAAPVHTPPVTQPAAPPPPVAVDNRAAEEALRPPIDLADMKLSMFLSLGKLSDAPVDSPAQPESPPASKTEVKPEAKMQPLPKAESKPEAKPESKAEPIPKPKSALPPAASPASAPEGKIDKRGTGLGHEMADAEYRKGMQAVKRGEQAAAQAMFLRALELDPGLAKARQALLSVLVGARQWGDAQRVAQAGLQLDSAQPGWAMILARLQFEQGDAVTAVDTLQRHAAHATTDADYQGFFAYLLQKQQRPAEAAERFKLALALRPAEGRWWFGLGLALESAGKAGEAREAYAKAREVGNLSADMAAVVDQKLR